MQELDFILSSASEQAVTSVFFCSCRCHVGCCGQCCGCVVSSVASTVVDAVWAVSSVFFCSCGHCLQVVALPVASQRHVWDAPSFIRSLEITLPSCPCASTEGSLDSEACLSAPGLCTWVSADPVPSRQAHEHRGLICLRSLC